MRYRQGKGPARIRQELREKQVSSDIIASLLDETDEIWVSLAREVKTRRFGTDSPQNLKERSKQMRFLQYRGFSPAQIQKLFR
jgi:regulatory protein